jgi:crotonobetainyl-CoA:carnitine CoA-transferase CaiB-like acyl-CoA transferase
MGEVLEGLRVLDLSTGSAGPVTSMLLADYGADVIRVERLEGDLLDAVVPASIVWGRGKRRVRIDLRDDAQRDRLLGLVDGADVLIENFRPGVAASLGVDHDTLLARNPRLIHCTITGYGSTGPLAERPGFDALVQARTGFGYEQPAIRSGPAFFASPLPSYGAALLADLGISAALLERERTGAGQHVETSLLQGILLWTNQPWSRAENQGRSYYAAYRPDARDIMPTPSYEAGDGRWVHPMAEVMGAVIEDLGDEAGTPPAADRSNEGMRATQAYNQSLFLKRSSQHWFDLLWPKDLRIQPCLSPEEAFEHPQLHANGNVHELDVAGVGRVRQFAHPYRISGTERSLRTGPQAPAPEVDWQGPSRAPTKDPAVVRGPGPLAGVRVVDFGLALAGPYGPMLLGDLGADVIRVENARGRKAAGGPSSGAVQVLSPEQARARAAAGVNELWSACQRSKRSISLDLKSPEGLAVAQALIATADVVHHNMRPGVPERLGIGFEDAKALNPRIIYCNVTGFGPDGPLGLFPGCDQMAQALSGLEFEQGATRAGGHPLWHRIGMTDHVAATSSVIGVLQALCLRERTGEPRLVEANILSAAASVFMSHYFVAPPGSSLEPWHLDGAEMGLNPLYRFYETSDGWLCIACLREKDWGALVKALDRPDLASDARFSDGAARLASPELAEELAGILRTRPAAAWFDALEASGAPCEIVSDTFCDDWYEDPHIRQNEMVTTYRHPFAGEVNQLGRLVTFSNGDAPLDKPPVVPGQHTRELLSELGYDDTTIQGLLDNGIAAAVDIEH